MGTICQQTEWVQRNAGKVGGQRRRKGMNEDKQATLVACTYLVWQMTGRSRLLASPSPPKQNLEPLIEKGGGGI